MHGSDPGALSTSGAGEQTKLPFILMRGGTSKAVFLRGDALPADPEARDAAILSLFGSPDPRQVDGLGGADLLTSKLAIIDPPSRPDADLDYTFAQVSISEPVVDYDINCGNISAAVGAFAVDEGMVAAQEPTTAVRIHNTNTRRILRAQVPVVAGAASVEGEQAIDGVPGTGAAIALDYSETAGGVTGALLPTGNETDVLETALGPIDATIVDLANLTVFFKAEAVGMTGTEGPKDFTSGHLEAVTAVKEAAAKLLGMAADGLTPVPALVSRPAPYTSFATGEIVAAADIDVMARVVGGRPPVMHKAYPGTVGACTGVAAAMSGTTVRDVTEQREPGVVRIGHPSGAMPIRARVHSGPDGWAIAEAAYLRTARRLAQGDAFIRRRVFDSPGTG